jgi:hypothetical protein
MVRRPDPRLLEYLTPYDRTVSGLVLALRALVLEEAPQASELLSKGYAVAIGFTFTGKLKDCFCHIATYAHHVNLGFNRGTSLADLTKSSPEPERTSGTFVFQAIEISRSLVFAILSGLRWSRLARAHRKRGVGFAWYWLPQLS